MCCIICKMDDQGEPMEEQVALDNLQYTPASQIDRRVKVTLPDTVIYTSLSHDEQCFHMIHFLCSPPMDRMYLDFMNDKCTK